MPIFATDIDLLYWEPNLMRDAAAVAQTVLSGTGSLSGTAFTLAAGSLLDANVTSKHVITLGQPIDGSFPIIQVDSATELTLSVLYDQLHPPKGQPVSPGEASNIPFWIRTFWPQRQIISDLLEWAAGIDPATQTIVNPDSLRRACALGALHMIYSALAAVSESSADLLVRAELYERLYRRALRGARVEIDLDADGTAEVTRSLNVLKLQRS